MGFEISNIDGNTPLPQEGLGREKNQEIAQHLTNGNYDGLLQIISQEQDKQTACEVIQHSMKEFNEGSRAESITKLLNVAFNNVDQYGDALKELILYAWKNNLQGERFWKNPTKDETLFIDDDGELISFRGEIGTFSGGDSKGMNYIKTLGKYEVITGSKAGQVFDGSDENDSLYRPIKGPEMKK